MRTVVLDPGVLLNVAAGDFLPQLASRSLHFIVPEEQNSVDGADEQPSAHALVASGAVQTAALEGDGELELFVEYAALADETEAAAAALAHSRQWILATDEAKLCRHFRARTGRTDAVVSTLQLLIEWAALPIATRTRTGEVVRRLHSIALFAPARSAAAYDWWVSQCRLAGVR